MRAGDLNHRMRMQARTVTTDTANGQQVESFADVGVIWLGRKYTGGGETVAAGVERTKQNVEFWARWPNAQTLSTKHRLVDAQGSFYNVLNVEPNPRRGIAVITAETGLNDG
jgi:SPP1 family predicted phage head-tail adaptor